MPVRQTPLVTGHYYHIYNRGVARGLIFHTQYDYRYMLQALAYYRYPDPPDFYHPVIFVPDF